MKIRAFVCKKVEMEVDDKFAELLENENDELKDELFNIVYAEKDVIDVSSVWDENGKICIIEC